ncbi:hypothetical protein BUALT_Bualt18G0106200 [Buddleja alternifolia]|uniref:Uncharacterized protein n=1 Tax=Buddleja alternifolia TaxID=168488 RepID=A0AAV6W514_9LAMI|nr:hypothetical protein BUALT_Bualt18G0106200 [Buddleja alternifolia]
MAAPPVKSQPLHNFSLSQLKWARKNPSSAASSHHHRFRRRDSPDQHHHRYPEPESDPETRPTNPKQPSPRNDAVPAAAEEENGEGKPWKLRPRKIVIKATSSAKKETVTENNDSKSNGVKSQRLLQNGGAERNGKRKVWISLSKEEIEEDVYALTGGKPNRRPRKWPRNVQKQLDNVFPGLYLVGVAADSYRVMMLWYGLRFSCCRSCLVWDCGVFV